MRIRLNPLPLFVPVILLMSTAHLSAQQSDTVTTQPTIEENAEERINFSGKLRMLSQRIPAAACALSRGIDEEGARTLLTAAPAEFEKILTALEFGGDADLNINAPETRKKTLMRIHELRKQWEPLKAAAEKVADGTADNADLDLIYVQNLEVLKAAVALVPELVKQYSNPNAVPYADLLLIDISGRQRMLTQKMSKEACFLGTDQGSAKTAENLEGTVQIFEASLDALRFGLPEMSLREPPNREISDGLEVVLNDWNRVKPLLNDVLEGQSLNAQQGRQNFQGLNTTMSNMNKVVGMYTQAAKPSS